LRHLGDSLPLAGPRDVLFFRSESAEQNEFEGGRTEVCQVVIFEDVEILVLLFGQLLRVQSEQVVKEVEVEENGLFVGDDDDGSGLGGVESQARSLSHQRGRGTNGPRMANFSLPISTSLMSQPEYFKKLAATKYNWPCKTMSLGSFERT
jgi:hypothetical protein